MAELPTYDHAKFPANGFMEKKIFKDIEDSDADLINQYNAYIQSHNIADAKQLLEDNPDLLTKMFGTEDVNTFGEELRNTEIVATQEKQSIYYQDKPVTFKKYDILFTDKE